MHLSYWEKTTFFNKIDYAIIGSGIVGLNAALTIKKAKPSAKVAVIERGSIPSGASTRNAGFACFGSTSELLDDLETATKEEVLELVELRWKGLQKLRGLLGDQHIDYLNYGAYELFQSEKKFSASADRLNELNNDLRAITGAKKTYTIADHQITNFQFEGVQHLIKNECEGQINTGRMMTRLLTLAKESGIQIYNGITIQKIEKSPSGPTLITDQNWKIKAKKILVATNGFATHLLPELQVKPARNQVLITKPIPNLPIKGCFHFDKGYVYFRNVGDRVLLGGGRNQAPLQEETDQFGFTENIQEYLLELLNKHILPSTKFEVDHWWSGIMGVGKVKRPIIKPISEHIIVAVRLGGMGVAIGSLIGEQAANVLLKQ